MVRRSQLLISGLVLLLAVLSCTSPAPTPSSTTWGPASGVDQERTAAAPRRVSMVIRGDIPTLLPGARGAVPGADELDNLVTVGLTTGQRRGEPFIARLAETLPSAENGL